MAYRTFIAKQFQPYKARQTSKSAGSYYERMIQKAIEDMLFDKQDTREILAGRYHLSWEGLCKRIDTIIKRDSIKLIPALAGRISQYFFLIDMGFPYSKVNLDEIAAPGGLFNQSEPINDVTDGRFYTTKKHCWLTNLSWMLAHFHRGNRLFVCSSISRNYLRRTTDGYRDQVSGFAREIAVALGVGYEMHRLDNGAIVLIHPRPGDLINLGLLDVAMSESEFIKYYERAIVKYNELIRKRKSQAPLRETKTPIAKKIKVEGEKGRIADSRQEKEQEKTKSRIPASSSANALAAAVSRASSNPTITEREFSRLMLAWAAADAENSGPREAAEMLQKQANNLGYNCREVAMDGDCFFHAVADQLRRLGYEGQDIDSAILRKLVAAEISSHFEYYEAFIPQAERANFAGNMAKPGTWVGQIATLAIARLKKINVVVVPHNGVLQVKRAPGATQYIVLGNEVDFHFWSLVPKTGKVGTLTNGLAAALRQRQESGKEIETEKTNNSQQASASSSRP